MTEIILEPVLHRNKKQMLVKFPYNNKLIQLIKTIDGARWSQTHKSWLIKDGEQNVKEIYRLFEGVAVIDLKNNIEHANIGSPSPTNLTDEAIQKIEKFKYWLRSKRYSESTISTYTDALKTFLRFYNTKTVHEIGNDDIINFNNKYILANKYSASFQNQVVNAIKLFFRKIENTNMDIGQIHRPKREKRLPNVLSKEEVKLILNAHGNIKHKAMLSLIYSCGLRCGELLSLKPEHIDSNRNVLIIKQAKGRKDRIAPLSIKIVEMLRAYFVIYKPSFYLFEGQTKGQPYDARSLQQVLKQSLEKVKIYKPVSLHWLRHSYATHLLENGTDLRYIQEILGHSSSKTTEIYTHVSTKNIQKITSPFDYL